MNTTLKVTLTATIVVLIIAALGVGFAFAQTPRPPAPWSNGYGMMGGYGYQNGTAAPGYGYGMMGGYAQNGDYSWMNNMHQWMFNTGGMHTLVWNGLADALGLTPDELNAQLISGKTLAQIAEAQGVSQEQLAAALETSVKAGLDKAVADGVLPQQQADWVFTRMAGNYEWMLTRMGTGYGAGGCHGNFAPQGNS